MIAVFILTYEGIECLDAWFNPENYCSDTLFFIVDNGRQTIPERLKPYICHVTERNIGCAGGYNLMLDIAFDMGFDTVILAQDDGPVTQEQLIGLDDCFHEATVTPAYKNGQLVIDDRFHQVQRHMPTPPRWNSLIGLFGNGFSFAIILFHKSIREKVGRFDENYLFGRREDNDYINRCKLAGIGVYHFNVPPTGKVSVIPNDYVMSFHQNNLDYYYAKWGYGENYTHPFDCKELSPFETMPISFEAQKVYGDITEFPSETEFKRYKEMKNEFLSR